MSKKSDIPAQGPLAEAITLQLTPGEIDTVLGMLGLGQHVLVNDLIDKITAQAMPQADAIGRKAALAAAHVDIALPN